MRNLEARRQRIVSPEAINRPAVSKRNDQAASSAANAPPPPENWIGNYCRTTYIMLARDSKLTAKTLSAQLEAFGERHVPASQAQLVQPRLRRRADHESHRRATSTVSCRRARPYRITTVLLVLGGLVLVVACVNYANLATAQAGAAPARSGCARRSARAGFV
jgi:hypothetical protein